MTADLDTLCAEDYGSALEVLPVDAFARSRAQFDGLLGWLTSADAAALAHGELEDCLSVDGRELLRLLLQDHLDVRAAGEVRVVAACDRDGVTRSCAEAGRSRGLVSVFGQVTVSRIAYRSRGCSDLHPADAILNLPAGKHSHGLRRLAAIEATRGSFDDALAAIERCVGVGVGKRQAEQLAALAAVDFEDFYAQRQPPAAAADGRAVLVISCDGKGVVMRSEALRENTRKAAACAKTKLKTRLSKGEKPHRKRIAEVGAVYDVVPVARTVADVIAADDAERDAAAKPPTAANKWLTASLVDDAATVVSKVFDEAERRDSGHQRAWVALVDGNNHQINRIQIEAHARAIKVAIVCDFVHVVEYLWKAAWSFHDEGDPAADLWVRDHARQILAGHATDVAAHIRDQAAHARLTAQQRRNADTAATYLTNKAPYLDYPTALAAGWPIATGVIEGACRHLVKDRMDITGARWGLQGAEAVLKLRATISNGDLDDYWRYHLAREHHRVHTSRYADNRVPIAA